MRLGNKTIQILAQLLQKSKISEYNKMNEFLQSYSYPPNVIFQFKWIYDIMGIMDFPTSKNWGKIRLLEINSQGWDSPGLVPMSVDEFTFKLAEDVLNELTDKKYTVLDINYSDLISNDDTEKLLRFLELDGYTFINNKLIPIDLNPNEIKEVRNILFQKISTHTELNSKNLFYEIEQCEENYAKGKGHSKDCISNCRNFVEQLLEDIAKSSSKARGESPDLSQPVRVREYLLKSGFFDIDEKEKLVGGIYGYFSEKGSHPGIPDDKATRIARNIMLNFGYYLLEKFETWKKNNFKNI